MFDKCEFGKKIYFREINFAKEARFNSSQVDGHFEFFEADLRRFGDFNRLSGTGNILFTTIKKNIGSPALRFTDIKTFTGEIFLNNFNLERASFMDSLMEPFQFGNVRWVGKKNKVRWIKESWLLKWVFRESLYRYFFGNRRVIVLRDEIKSRPGKIEINSKIGDLYTQLRRKFDTEKIYTFADSCHFAQLEMRRLSYGFFGRYIGWESWYKLFSFYGHSWMRPLLWAVAIWSIVLVAILLNIDGAITLCWGFFDQECTFYPAVDYHILNTIFASTTKLAVGTGIKAMSFFSKLFVGVMVGFSIFAVRRKFRI